MTNRHALRTKNFLLYSQADYIRICYIYEIKRFPIKIYVFTQSVSLYFSLMSKNDV
jgi:hypothetical protein